MPTLTVCPLITDAVNWGRSEFRAEFETTNFNWTKGKIDVDRRKWAIIAIKQSHHFTLKDE